MHLPGNHDAGWNDPPQFSYDAQKQGTITASNPLATNKRVGHDLSATSYTTSGGDSACHTGDASFHFAFFYPDFPRQDEPFM